MTTSPASFASTGPSANGGSRRVRLRIPARAEYITLGRLALTGLSRLRELSDETLADLKLALTEACSNSVRHAYRDGREGIVEIVYDLQPDRLVIEVSDDGPGFDYVEAEGEDRGLTRRGAGSRDHSLRLRRVRARRQAAARRVTPPLREEPPLRRSRWLSTWSTSGASPLADYAHDRQPWPDGRDPPPGGAARRKAHSAPVGDGVRRRGRGDQLHAGSADGRRRPGRRVADHPGPGRVLQGHQGDPQRPAGEPAWADRVRSGGLPALQRRERARVRRTTTTS